MHQRRLHAKGTFIVHYMLDLIHQRLTQGA